MVTKKFEWNLFDIDYNKFSKAYNQCTLEFEKINTKVNNRKLSEIKNVKIAHILNIFEFKE